MKSLVNSHLLFNHIIVNLLNLFNSRVKFRDPTLNRWFTSPPYYPR